MYLAIIIIPLLGSIVAGLFGRKIGVSGAHIITSLSIVVTTTLAIIGFFEVGLTSMPVSINLIRWIDSESLNVLWSFQFDSLTVSMLIPVLVVSSLVHIYSIGYMSHDPHQQRFFSYLSLFTFMMVILVTSNNYLLMFVGWEGVGVCSYLLVSFWFTRIAANQSSISAFLTNRVGDCFLTIGMFGILWSVGNVDYSTVFSLAPFINENIVTIIGICLLIGAMAKSSQVGLHVWLPMAMEGPTPVSALIHAATMVTAGVYLLMRSSPLIEYSSTVLLLCLWLGAITTVFSSLIGLFQQDIKKVIAYSTMSQLGMMVIALGLSLYNVALFHLVNHAFYKALLFLGAGSVIHAVADNQDFRKYGGLRSFLPLTYSVMLIASLSLVAFPFMTGFYSKDFILESAYGGFTFSGVVVYYIATIGAVFTTLYSVKVLYLTFLSYPYGSWQQYLSNLLANHYKHPDLIAQEGNIFMNLPLIILAIFSIFFGFISKDIFIGLGSAFFSDNSLFIYPSHEIMLDTEFAVSTIFKLLPLVFTVIFSILAIIVSEYCPKFLIYFKLSRIGYNIFTFFNQRFFIELLYNKYISGLIYYKLGKQTSIVLDKGSLELLGPYGLEKVLLVLSKDIHKLSTGIITNYALYMLIGLIFYMSLSLLTIHDIFLFISCILGLISIINNKRIKLIINPLLVLVMPPKKCGFYYFNKKLLLKHISLRAILSGIFIIGITFIVKFYALPFIFRYNQDLCYFNLPQILQWLISGNEKYEDLLLAFFILLSSWPVMGVLGHFLEGNNNLTGYLLMQKEDLLNAESPKGTSTDATSPTAQEETEPKNSDIEGGEVGEGQPEPLNSNTEEGEEEPEPKNSNTEEEEDQSESKNPDTEGDEGGEEGEGQPEPKNPDTEGGEGQPEPINSNTEEGEGQPEPENSNTNGGESQPESESSDSDSQNEGEANDGSDSGYEHDTDLPGLDDTAHVMNDHAVEEITDDYLRRYIREQQLDIEAHKDDAEEHKNKAENEDNEEKKEFHRHEERFHEEMANSKKERKRELRHELNERKRKGQAWYDPSDTEDTNSSNDD